MELLDFRFSQRCPKDGGSVLLRNKENYLAFDMP